MPFSHGREFSKATRLLRNVYDVIQPYEQGAAILSWTLDSEFSTGTGTCLRQKFDVIQLYTQGIETVPIITASTSAGEIVCLTQTFDVCPSHDFRVESVCFSLNCNVVLLSSVLQTWSTFSDTYSGSHSGAVPVKFDTVHGSIVESSTLYDVLNIIGSETGILIQSRDDLSYRYVLCSLATDEVVLDEFGSSDLGAIIRHVSVTTYYDVFKLHSVCVAFGFDVPESGRVLYASSFDTIAYGHALLHLQDSALYSYIIGLTNVVTGYEIVETSIFRTSVSDSIKEFCVEDSEWELEFSETVDFQNPSKPSIITTDMKWRFLTDEGKHYKTMPQVYNMAANKLPSSFELQFEAVWPYLNQEALIQVFELKPTEIDAEFVDLGVWTSESAWVDTTKPPLLTLPYSQDVKNYSVHVPYSSETRFIAVAPIRKYPREEIGKLVELYVS